MFFVPVKAKENADVFPLQGIVVSNIALQSFDQQYQNTPLGLMKADSPVDLLDDEYFATIHSVPLFSRITLFTYSMQGNHKMDESDLINYYNSLSSSDVEERERTTAAILSLYKKDGTAVEYALPSEPEVTVTYRIESTSSGIIKIPERHIKKTNEITTYFLLDPSKVADGERLSLFDIAKTYDIDPCFFNTLVERNQLANRNIDFSGFYVDVPQEGIDEGYLNVLSTSLKKLSEMFHSQNKLLIVENLTKNTLSLGQYSDIIGITLKPGDYELLKDARLAYPDKQIFLTFNGTLLSTSDIKALLDNCAFYGIYPEFRRDIQTGEFFYYENTFSENIALINSRLLLIRQLNEAGFKKILDTSNESTAIFGSSSFSFHCLKGNGTIVFNLNDNTNYLTNHPFEVINEDGKAVSVAYKNNSFEISTSVYGFAFLRVAPKDFSPLYLGAFPAPSNKTGWQMYFINTGLAKGQESISLKSSERTLPITLDLAPMEETTIDLDELPVNVSFENSSFAVNPTKQNRNYGFAVILVVLIAMVFVAFLRKMEIKKTVSRQMFALIAVALSIIVIFINRMYVHYSTTTITYILFALLYLLYAFEGSNVKNALLASLFMVFAGLLYNFLEFGMLAPAFFNGIPPIRSFEQFLLFFPFIFTAFFFFTSDGKNIAKAELLVIFLAISSLLFFFDSVSVPFLETITLRSLMPFLVILAGVFLLEIFYKNLDIKRAMLIGAGFAVVLLSMSLSSLYFAKILNPSKIMLPLKDFFLLLAPILFLVLRDHNKNKRNPDVSINILALSLILLIFAYFIISEATLLRLGSPYFTQIGYISIPLILSLFTIIFIEQIYMKNIL
jgi:hypothetical protein